MSSTPQKKRTIGITSWDARYRVKGWGSAQKPDFSGLRVGILAEGIFDGIENSVVAETNSFDNVSQGIVLRNTVGDLIQENIFQNIPVPQANGLVNFGLFSEGASGSHIVHNTFNGLNHLNVRGTVNRNGLDAMNRIYDNGYNNFLYSTQIEQNNEGLSVRCNRYSNVGASAWNVIGNGDGNLGPQGLPQTSGTKADNQFYDHCNNDPGSSDPDLRSDYEFDYYDKAGNPNPAEDPCVAQVIDFDPGGFINLPLDCNDIFLDCPGCNENQLLQTYNGSSQTKKDLMEYLGSALNRYDKSYAQNYSLIELDQIRTVLSSRSDDLSSRILSASYSHSENYSLSSQERATINLNDFHNQDYVYSQANIENYFVTAAAQDLDNFLQVSVSNLDIRSSSVSKYYALDNLLRLNYEPPVFLVSGGVESLSRSETDEGIYEKQIELNLQPNPVEGLLSLSGTNVRQIQGLRLISSSGMVVKVFANLDANDSEMLLDVSDLPVGLYLLELRFDTYILSRKIIKH